jgi:hypothetical protein
MNQKIQEKKKQEEAAAFFLGIFIIGGVILMSLIPIGIFILLVSIAYKLVFGE